VTLICFQDLMLPVPHTCILSIVVEEWAIWHIPVSRRDPLAPFRIYPSDNCPPSFPFSVCLPPVPGSQKSITFFLFRNRGLSLSCFNTSFFFLDFSSSFGLPPPLSQLQPLVTRSKAETAPPASCFSHYKLSSLPFLLSPVC